MLVVLAVVPVDLLIRQFFTFKYPKKAPLIWSSLFLLYIIESPLLIEEEVPTQLSCNNDDIAEVTDITEVTDFRRKILGTARVVKTP